jgi:hypothetical protein
MIRQQAKDLRRKPRRNCRRSAWDRWLDGPDSNDDDRIVNQQDAAAGVVLFNLLEEAMVRNTRPYIKAT